MPGVSNGDVQKAYPSVKAAGKAWGIGHDKIYDAIRRGQLEARKLGKRTILTEAAMEKFIASLPKIQLPPPSP
jgi:hypothetical protein